MKVAMETITSLPFVCNQVIMMLKYEHLSISMTPLKITILITCTLTFCSSVIFTLYEGGGVGGYVSVLIEVRVPYSLDALEQQIGPFNQLGARGHLGEGCGFDECTHILLPR